MLVAREALLRAGGRQLSRALSGLHSADGSPGRSCGSTGGARNTSSNTAAPGPLVVSSAPGTIMANTEVAFPTLEKLRLLGNKSVRIKDPTHVEALLSTIVAGGFPKLQFVVDFDFTLTRVHYKGQPCHCSWGILDNSLEMPMYYREEANSLFSKYYPIEIDPKMMEEEKIPYMLEWYGKIHDLLVKCNLNQGSIKGMVSTSTVMLRDGAADLCKRLHQAGVPILVLSAGMGDVLEHVLWYFNIYTDNVKVVSNFFKYNEKGIMVGFKGKIIHVFNKNEDAIHSSNYFEKLRLRTNVILMGDSIGDVKMALGVPQPNSVLKIGFLNGKISERLESFMDKFDIVLLDDQTMDLAKSIVDLMES